MLDRMSRIIPLADHLAPDSIYRLERAAEQRYDEADRLVSHKRLLAAVYFYGYSVEMCLSVAYYRSAGFPPNAAIDQDTRRRRMAQARQLQTSTGQPLMSSDPHPLVGWARFLEWQRSASATLSAKESQRLKECIHRAESVYKHWRPELRYKTTDVTPNQLGEVRGAASWFLDHRRLL
jgi:hypothetical protein